ncbi:MAG: tripartite tricarboxylate transporter substrate binding protein [Betaproteobacteria bacterium]|nr:tripartite tricarboxylate transporter substrate binding protein [Betaproteobacteria bacterium]
MNRVSLLALAACVCTSLPVFSQGYASKPVRLVIPFPPGGVDVTARPLLPTIEKEIGQPLIMEYRSGAGGIVGHEYVARQPADGYTLLITLANSWVVAPTVRRTTPFDPAKDFTPISLGYEPMGVIVAHPSFAPNDLRELVVWAKQNPGKGTWATSGTGSSWHINGELAKLRAGFEVVHAPYQGFGPMIPAILGGQVPLAMFAYSTIYTLANAGKIKILGVTNAHPMFKSLVPPGMQTLADLAPGLVTMPDWIGLSGPAGMPDAIVRRLNAAYVKALNEPESKERFLRDKTVLVGSTPEQFAERVKSDLALVARSMKEAGIPPQD